VAADPRVALGLAAENMTCGYLLERGYEIVGRNVRVGRLEIDIIAKRGPLAVFCEVRSRRSDRWMTPAQSVDAGKIRRIRQAAAVWLKSHGIGTSQTRFDVASVIHGKDGPIMDYFERAF